MTDPIRRHQKFSEQLSPVHRLGLPQAGLSIMFSEERDVVEAGYLWIGEKRRASSRTIARAGRDLNGDLDADGNFIGLELLRRVTSAEAKRFYQWAHKQWNAPKGKPHWPCSALKTLLEAWRDAEMRVCPHCREIRGQREAAERKQWTPELAVS